MKKKECYFLIHGIRTFPWQMKNYEEHFKKNIESINPFADVHSCIYGYYNILRLLFCDPEKVIDYVYKDLSEKLFYYDKVYILAFSFGTWLTIKSIERLDFKKNNAYLGLFGGIVKCRYDFRSLHNKVNVLFNFCSLEDDVSFLGKFIGKGSCGKYGFRHRTGVKADTTRHFEPVRVPVTDKDKFPFVINIHENDKDHSDWCHNINHALNFLNYIHLFSRHEK